MGTGMRHRGVFGILLGAASMLAASLAFAQEEVKPSDGIVMLPCDGQCVTITRNPNKVSGADIRLPDPGVGPVSLFAEGLVELQYTIKADGSVANDVDILRLVGPQSFADAAKRAVRGWRYEPATVNGQPVSITHKLRVYYGAGGDRSARSSIVTTYNESADLIKAGKLEEADDKLAGTLRLPRMNFYERGMVSYLRTLIAMQRQDCVEAQRISGLTLAFGHALLRSTHEDLFRINITATLCVGDVVRATKTLESFEKAVGLSKTDPLALQVANMKEKIDALPYYGMNAKIPPAGEADGFGFYLYRRDFTFTKIAGALFDHTISCRERQVDSPIVEGAEWHVPKGWSDCFVWVRGRPGTTFQIVQFASAQPAK